MESNKADKSMTKNVIVDHGSKANIIAGTVNIENYNDNSGKQSKIPKRLTTHLPTISPDKIIGRYEELADLHKRLFDNKQVVLVNGLGGIGKTTLAQAYLGKYCEEYNHVAWIGLISDDLHQDFMNTEGLLANLDIQSEGKTSHDIFLEILRKLQGIENKPCLMIIDNADTSLRKWNAYLPNQPHWHVLVTSRETIEGFDAKNLDFLSEDDAVALFLSHYTLGKIDESQIRKIAVSVDLHTLTVEIFAKTAQKQRSSFDDLMKAIQDDIRASVDVRHKGEKIERITSYLCSIFTLSKLSGAEIHLLKLMSCLPSEFHTFERLEMLIGPSYTSENTSLSETLENLTDKGWLLKNPDTESYKIHRIIMDVVKRETPILLSDVEGLIETITGTLSIDQTKDNPVEKFPWIPFGLSMLAVFNEEQEGASISLLQNNLATVLKALGDYVGAKDLFEKAMKSAETNFGPDHPNTAVSYSNLATILQDLGDYARAKDLLEKAMKFDETNFGPEHPITAVRYSNLALVLKDLGDYAGAKDLLEKAMKSDEANFGPEHSNTTRSYSNLATVLKDLGDYAGAKALFEKTMKSAETNFGPNHPTTAVSYSNLATVLTDLGDYSGAKILLEKAMKSAETNFGPDHPETARSYSNQAIVLRSLGDFTGAKALLEKATKSAETNFGPDHPTTAVRYSNLALVLKDLGDYKGALELSEKSVFIFSKCLPEGHPYIKQVIGIRDGIKQSR